jgi:C_GCAxxG_C_C family probable redox protein
MPNGELGEDLLRASATMPGGLAGSKDGPCGALLGGMMLIGALYGRAEIGEDDDRASAISRQWREDFRREFDTDDCAALREAQERKPKGESICFSLIIRSAELLAERLNKEL